jgi:hypothetical protein
VTDDMAALVEVVAKAIDESEATLSRAEALDLAEHLVTTVVAQVPDAPAAPQA